MDKILVPVDFSERSTAAAEHAVAMAAKFDSELIFLHAVPPGPYEHGFFEGGFNASAVWPQREEIEENLAAELAELIARISRGRKIEPIVVWGDPTTKIEEMAQHEQVDLIMMPTHGFGPFRRFALGSVTAKVLHDLDCPVFTGAHVEELPESATEPYELVSCAIDMGPHSEAVLRWASDFARAWGASLHVIHAAPPIDELHSSDAGTPADLRAAITKAKMAEISALLAKVGAEGRIDVDCAEAVDYVCTAAKDVLADILVIGRSTDTSLIGRLRTQSHAIIRDSPCPVISI
ncbi:MAG: universal stress protein [Bryobacterales bacterium]|nr:universal stress protein [Bryobacterales bacterium]